VAFNTHDENRIAKAAALRDTASAFARDAVPRKTDAVIAADAVVTLPEQESRCFLAALDEPFRPNARLKKAINAAIRLNKRVQSTK